MRVADMHCDTISELYNKRQAGMPGTFKASDLMVDLARLEKGGYGLQNFALFINLEQAEGRPFEACMKLVDLFYQELEPHRDRIGIVHTFEEIEKNWTEGRISALLTIEEGGVCQGELAYLRDFYRLGVRMMTLTWNYPNELGWPSRRYVDGQGRTRSEAETERGLTKRGIEFVEEMERLGMVIDLSHLGDAGIWDVLRHTRKPVVASHSNARALASHPRNLTDDMIRAVSRRGGVMGINYCAHFLRDFGEGEQPVSRAQDMVRHMKHIKQVGGVDCIGLGSDFDGIVGELEIKGPDQLGRLAGEMEREGFLSSEIDKIFSGNVLRVYRELL